MARKDFRELKYIRDGYKNDQERNYNRMNLLITDKIFDMFEYMGFNIRNEREDVFKQIKILKRNQRMRDHQNTYAPIKENIKKRMGDYNRKIKRKIQRKAE